MSVLQSIFDKDVRQGKQGTGYKECCTLTKSSCWKYLESMDKLTKLPWTAFLCSWIKSLKILREKSHPAFIFSHDFQTNQHFLCVYLPQQKLSISLVCPGYFRTKSRSEHSSFFHFLMPEISTGDKHTQTQPHYLKLDTNHCELIYVSSLILLLKVGPTTFNILYVCMSLGASLSSFVSKLVCKCIRIDSSCSHYRSLIDSENMNPLRPWGLSFNREQSRWPFCLR